MASSGEGKYDNIFKLLSEHNFHLQVKDKMKCVRCQNILINPCLSQCGCRFCRKCVGEILVSGCNACPGNTDDCKSENLSNIAPDYGMNMKISKLLAKCPEQMCEHECQLIEMEEHMRLCSKKPVQCPCHNLGCNDDDLVEDKINEHLQTQSYNHWTMLMGLIGDFRNEVAQLRRTENVNKNEIELLRNEIRAKDEKIEEMRKELTDKIRKCEVETEVLRGEMRAKDEMIDVMRDDTKSLKVETEMLRSQIETGNDNLLSKIDTMSCEMNVQIESIKTETNKLIKVEKAEWSGELANLNGKLEGIRVEVDARLDETRRGCLGHVEEQLVLIKGAMGKDQEQMAARLDEMKICLDGKIDGTRFVWPVDEIYTIGLVRLSEYFSPKINPYKIQLKINNFDSQLQIWLFISPGPNDEKLQWPFQAKVRVKVTNKDAPAVFVEDTKSCNLSRPPKNSFSFNYKDPFLFPIEDLSSKNLLLGDCCIVECFVDLQ